MLLGIPTIACQYLLILRGWREAILVVGDRSVVVFATTSRNQAVLLKL